MLDTDEAVFSYFRRHYEWCPDPGGIHRTTSARQAANLWKLKEELWQEILTLTPSRREILPRERHLSEPSSLPHRYSLQPARGTLLCIAHVGARRLAFDEFGC